MTSPLLLLRRGAGGLTPVEPVDFDRIELPASPNTCLVGPASYAGPKHLTHGPWAVTPAVLWATLNRVAAGFPRTWKLGEFPERQQSQWVERSALMNYPDIIAAEVRAAPEGAALLLYSRSLFGWSDLGVNQARAERWLAALDAALKP
jgi:uncharacterized protein (DUF1499 family)